MRSTPTYNETNFTHWPYAEPEAKKGGELSMSALGTFDTQNPYSPKGLSPMLIEELVFSQLSQTGQTEVFTQYPDLAEEFDLAPDMLSMRVKLNPRAHFADGKPVTCKDVRFSVNLFLSEQVNPFYNTYWSDIKDIKCISDLVFDFIFDQANPELAAIAGQIPILPEHFYSKGNFAEDFADTSLGAGPYYIAEFKRDSFIRYKKNPKYWGVNEPFNQGRYNFDEIEIKYFKDATAQVEGFIKGDFDFFPVNVAKVWARDLSDEIVSLKPWIKKETWQHHNNLGGQAYFFNLRRSIFQDVRVRKAIALAFDFSWTNRALFFGQYAQNVSFFQNSPLQASSSITEQEHAVLFDLSKKFPDDVPPEALTDVIRKVGEGMNRTERLTEAIRLLSEAGYRLQDGVQTNAKGEKLIFRFLIDGPVFVRITEPFIASLARLGIKASIDVNEDAVFQKKIEGRQFDLIPAVIGQTLSPGNEQAAMWGSAAADQKMSRNYSGLKNRAVDALVEKIIYAQLREDLVLYTRCLDRLLHFLHIAVHHWHLPYHRVALSRKYQQPKELPLYFSPTDLIQFMWKEGG